ncbi:MAG TPA: hypothetical protein VNW98_05980, partial [Burkholderiaceae bacterium]|nr:hypothetical protein [Burkholderiaceae bacterium]
AGSGPMVGWFPLGPHDVYVPGYHASRRYVETVNLQSARVSANTSRADWQPHYAYQANAGAVTWVHRDTVLLHRPVARALQLPPAHWNSAPVTYQAPIATPAPHSIGQGASRQVRNPQAQATQAQPAVSAAPVARRPPSPSPPTVGGEPGRRGHPLEQPIARAVPAPVPLPPAPVPRPVAPAASTPPAQAPAAEPGQQPPASSPQHEGAAGRAPAEAARGRTITR